MRAAGRCVITALVVCAALIAAVPTTVRSAITLTASGLYMGGTGHPLRIPGDTTAYIDEYVSWAQNNFVGPSGLCGPVCAPVAVYTPEQFWPLQGLKSMTFDDSVAAGVANLDNCLRATACTVTDPPLGTAPSATTTIENWRPAFSRSLIFFTTTLMSYGISGMSTTSAEPAMPDSRAIQPA